MTRGRNKHGKGRIAFPDGLWVAVPAKAIESGLLRELNASELRRWLVILREANAQSKEVGEKFQVTLEKLEQQDGASQRTSYRATRGLQARGVIWVDWNTKPLTYVLNWPTEWCDRRGRVLERNNLQAMAPVWPK